MSEPDRIRRLSLVGRVLLVLTGVLLSLALAELAVRAQVGSRPASFHIVNAVFGQYDAQFGQRFRPKSKKILSGGRWWCRGPVIAGRTRSQMHPRPGGFDDPRITNDEDVVDERATEEWCQQQLIAPQQDVVVKNAVAYHRAYLRSKGIAFDPFSLTKSYLIEAVWSTIFGRPFYSQTAFSLMPRVTATEFLADPGYPDAVQKLKKFGVPVVLVHLPNKAEILLGRPFRGREAESISTHLERDLGTRILTLAAMENRPPGA